MHFENLVFCGGGKRGFWQAGFWSALAPILYRQPSGVVAVSAGACLCSTLGADILTACRQGLTPPATNVQNGIEAPAISVLQRFLSFAPNLKF